MLALARCRGTLAAWALALGLWMAASPAAAIQEIRIGVLSHRGTDLTLAHWQATADYLTSALEGYRFEIVPLPFSRITEFVEMEFVDFILVNPGIYVDLEVRHGISRLATLNNRVGPLSLNQFSSVIFTRQERQDLNRLADLAGQDFLAVDETSLGGFEMAWDELLRQGVDPYHDFARLDFAGDHDSVVMAVLLGQADAGTVRTNILERMAAQGLIDLDQFKVLNPQPTDRFPLVHSTLLYPEWPFSKVSHTPSDLAQQVAVALLNMSPDHPAALEGSYAGWTVPLDYQPVHELFRRLKLPPYDHDFTLRDVVQRYLVWVVAGLVLLLLFAFLLYRIWGLNRQLLKAKTSLEAQHLLILNSVADGIYGVDREGNSTFVNRAMAEMTGWRAEEVVGRNQHELLHHTRIDGSPFPAQECPVYRSCRDGKARHIPEDRFWRKDGSHFPVEYACSPLRDDNGGIVGGVVVFRDISERQHSEEASRRHQLELAHRDRLNTLGEMAAGIAHEINQPLTAIASNAQACIRLLDAGLDADRAGRLSDALAHIALQAQRGGDIIRQVRQFVKKDAPVKTAVDINELIERVMVLIRPQAQGAGVQIHTQFAPDLPRVWVQDIQIQQVIINLATNAIDAMADPGLPEHCLTIATAATPGQVDVVVQDTGTGVDPAMRTEIFKQFVTSKRRGMGLGLSISKGILDAHEGRIVLEATGPTGTRFRFSLAAPGT
ncbi:MAG: PhnD/SsuA/transferrin family substrate-binding protein [Chromatiaceae bacterium]